MSRLYFRIYLSAVVKVAFCYALAYFTRYAAVALLPVVVRSLVRDGYSDNPGRRAVRLAVFVGSVMLFLLPHFILTTHVFGDPFYQENWRNLAMKMYGGYDWSYLKDNPFDGFLSVIASDPVRFISMAVRELGKFIFVDLIRLGGFGITGGLFAAAAMGGLYLAWLSRDRGRVLLMVYLVFFVGLVCTFFYTSPRFMLPILPVGYILSGYFILSSRAFFGFVSIASRRIQRSLPAAAVFLVFISFSTVRETPVFIASHPTQTKDAAVRLQKEFGTAITVVGTCPVLKRYVDYDYEVLELEGGKNAEPDYPALKAALAMKRADFLLISRPTMSGFLEKVFIEDGDPPFLETVLKNDEVVVFRFIHSE